ncbi:MAG: RlmE family RNA methyltransferase [Phycisphaerales bacterium]|nr:RlmE family RNA methyltransferase [Phycisphaerales bacterium]
MARRILHDEYFNKAKAEGYAARSAYKLLQINESRRILKKGDTVLDLGCAPGSWMQAASEIVGPKGRIVGIDLKEVRHAMPPNVTAIVGDIYDIDADKLLELAGNPTHGFDVVISDMAPNTTGHNEHELSVRLCERILELLPALLKPNGNITMKVFEGGDYPRLLKDTARLFNQCKGLKPKATRGVSREMYIVGVGYKGLSSK